MKKHTPKKSDDSQKDDSLSVGSSKPGSLKSESLKKETPTINLPGSIDNNKETQNANVSETPLNEKISNSKKESFTLKNKDVPQKSAKKYLLLVSSFIFIIAISAVAFSVYNFWLLQAQTPINTQLKNTQAELETQLNTLQQQILSTDDQLSKEVQARLSVQSEHQAVNAALQSITEKLGRSTVAWRMAEVEYLLTVANHRLTLAQDRQTAIAIFETADNRLMAIGDPSLLKVRKKIASELTALRAVPVIDTSGLAVQIGSLAETVNQLPLLDKKRLAPVVKQKTDSPPLDWQKIPAAVWSDVKSLVKIRRHQQPTEPLLPPKQAWFLYQNLQLKLEQARLAVLKENTALFSQSLNEVSLWLSSYFEPESAAVKSMQATVKQLNKIDLQPELPDVSGSLRALRTVMSDRSPLHTSSIQQSLSYSLATPVTMGIFLPSGPKAHKL